MLLVTGATGQLGSSVVTRLLERADTEVAALVRDEGKGADLAARGVSVRLGEYDDAASLDRAMAGVDRVLLIAGNDPPRRMAQHQNVIDAARRADVALLGFASRSLKDVAGSDNPLMSDYVDTEGRITASGLPHVFFRNALYLDTVPFYVGGARVLDTGIRLPAGDGTVAFALRREMGEALANAMADGGGPAQAYVVAAAEAHGFADIAAALSDLSGREVGYAQVSDEEYVASAVQAGLPEAAARRFLGFYADIRDGQLSETSTDLQTLLGRPPATLRAGLAELFAL